jgi:hypothetical protein
MAQPSSTAAIELRSKELNTTGRKNQIPVLETSGKPLRQIGIAGGEQKS